MKLIDLLVQELPKRGGWPKGTNYAAQDYDGQACFFTDEPFLMSSGDVWSGKYVHEQCFYFDTASDFNESMITRAQYEAALAAEQPQWDGEGLPPVGCECEYETKFNGWQPVRIELIKSEGIAFTWLANSEAYNGLDCVGVQKAGSFRPIRSEADKKRDAACDSMHKWWREVVGQQREDGSLIDIYSCIYDAIAAGQIPHIRIE